MSAIFTQQESISKGQEDVRPEMKPKSSTEAGKEGHVNRFLY